MIILPQRRWAPTIVRQLDMDLYTVNPPLNGRKSMGVSLKLWVPLKGNWFSRAHLTPTSHHKTSPQPSTPLAFRWPLGSPNSSNWDMWSSQRSASPGDGRQQRLADKDVEKIRDKKPLRKKMGVVKHKNCTLHEINLDTCVFSKNNISTNTSYIEFC